MSFTRISLPLMIMLSALVALVSYRFLFLGIPLSFQGMDGHIEARFFSFLAHIVASPVALLLGALQLWPRLRSKAPIYHRWAGRLYALAVLVGGISGFIIALGAEGGLSAQIGFALLAVCWLWATFNGVQFARSRNFTEHRRWMIRSFAMTFGGVTLRLMLPLFALGGLEYTQASVYLAWLAWVPNLIAVEWWMRRKVTSPKIT